MSYFSDNFDFGAVGDAALTWITSFISVTDQYGLLTFILAILFGLLATVALLAVLSQSFPEIE